MSQTPPRKIRLVQIGFGNIGMRRTRITKEHRAIELAGVVDIDRDRLNLAREIVGESCLLGVDYLDVLRRARADAAIISTPNYLHAPMTIACLDLGAHVLCEKPLAVNAALAARCVDRAGRLGLRLKVGSNHRYFRGVREALARVRAGAIGPLTRISGEIGHLLPNVASEWYREKEHSGGGAMIDHGPHLIDAVGQILRVSDGDHIARVRGATSRESLHLEVEDRATGTLVTARGKTIDIATTWSDGAYRMKLEILGEQGRIVVDGFEPLLIERREGVERLDLSHTPPGESWEMDVEDFVDAILFGHEPYASGVDGMRSVRVIDALYESARRESAEVVV
jgi:predicted dehydrogenase